MVAESVSAVVYGAERAADLCASAEAVYGNALRIAGELPESADAFARANRWLEQGSEASVEALQVLELEVLLRRDHQDFEGALA